MTEALHYMMKLINEGWESSDAAYRAARQFKVNQQRLEALYDSQLCKGI